MGAANELRIDQEWFQISPWGEWPNRVGLQKVQAEDGRVLVAAFNAIRGRVANWRGVPIFAGHPDYEPDKYPDKRRYGKLTNLAVRQDGLYGQVEWNDLGRQSIEQGHYLYVSPAWYLRRDGRFVRPVELKSVGLTNTPNIPGEPWAKNERTETMWQWLKDLLVSKGLLKAEGTEENARTAINDLIARGEKVANLEQQLSTATNERTALTTERDTLKGQVTTLTSERDTLKGQVTSLNTARVDRELELAVNDGRITAAEQDGWRTRLGVSFAAASKELKGLKATVNTRPLAAGVAGRKDEANAVKDGVVAINDAVADYAGKHGINLQQPGGWDRAYRAVKKEKPELFKTAA